jgi:hypothetical protein
MAALAAMGGFARRESPSTTSRVLAVGGFCARRGVVQQDVQRHGRRADAPDL